MIHRWAARTLVLTLCIICSGSVAGQSSVAPPPAPGHKLGTLGLNYPNPFKPDTFIPFTIDDCNGPGGQRLVTLRVYNVLAQLVATPILHGASRPLVNLRLSCGEYVGYWDGMVGRTRRHAASGVYVYELVVDGQRMSQRKMFLAK